MLKKKKIEQLSDEPIASSSKIKKNEKLLIKRKTSMITRIVEIIKLITKVKKILKKKMAIKEFVEVLRN